MSDIASTTTLHFTKHARDLRKFMTRAQRIGCQSTCPYENLLSLQVTQPTEPKNHKKYLKLMRKYSQKKYTSIFTSESGLNKLKPHVRKNPNASTLKEMNANTVGPFQPQIPLNYGNTASVMGAFYNFPPQQATAPTIAIISLGGTYLTSDLTHYWTVNCGLSTYPVVTYVNVNGTTNAPNQTIVDGDASDENTLDIEIAGALCPTSKIVVYFGVNSFQGFYNAIATAVFDTVNNPKIISISWGAPEAYFSSSQLTAYDQLFTVANARGIQICVASGDNSCDDGIGDGRPHIDFPSASPHVVSCGGTTITGASTESVWSYNRNYGWGTGGGLSAKFLKPPFQTNIVTYPSTSPSTSSLKNHRATPDIAMNADPLTGWSIYFDGVLYTSAFGGTSCVAPAMAGLLGLINRTYPTNFCTTLYSIYPSAKSVAFRDITVGNNDSIRRSTNVWKATNGFDMCTGLGSLKGVQLLTALGSATK
jgi:kumamolisin